MVEWKTQQRFLPHSFLPFYPFFSFPSFSLFYPIFLFLVVFCIHLQALETLRSKTRYRRQAYFVCQGRKVIIRLCMCVSVHPPNKPLKRRRGTKRIPLSPASLLPSSMIIQLYDENYLSNHKTPPIVSSSLSLFSICVIYFPLNRHSSCALFFFHH